MFITPSFKKSLIVEQFQGNYLKCMHRLVSVCVLLCGLHEVHSHIMLWLDFFLFVYLFIYLFI